MTGTMKTMTRQFKSPEEDYLLMMDPFLEEDFMLPQKPVLSNKWSHTPLSIDSLRLYDHESMWEY